MTTEQDAGVIVSEINDIHSAFDRIGEQFGCERIKTVGDAYISIAGLPEPLEDHQLAVTETALRFVRYLTRRNESHPHQWRCRIGLASGAVIGSVVGIQKYVYDVFGPAVNISAKVRDSAGPMEIIAHDGMSASLATRLSLDAVGVLEIDGAEAAKLHRVTSAPAA